MKKLLMACGGSTEFAEVSPLVRKEQKEGDNEVVFDIEFDFFQFGRRFCRQPDNKRQF
jgi:hypothetical protein